MQAEQARRPKVGLLLNQEEGPGVATPRWDAIREVARAAQAAGVDSLWLVDHFLWQGDPWERDGAGNFGVLECWTTLAALAEATTRPRLGTLVTCSTTTTPRCGPSPITWRRSSAASSGRRQQHHAVRGASAPQRRRCGPLPETAVGAEGEELGEVVGKHEPVEQVGGIGPWEVGRGRLQLGEFLVADGGVALRRHR